MTSDPVLLQNEKWENIELSIIDRKRIPRREEPVLLMVPLLAAKAALYIRDECTIEELSRMAEPGRQTIDICVQNGRQDHHPLLDTRIHPLPRPLSLSRYTQPNHPIKPPRMPS
ncbi:hypothetical protein KQX54_003095 [Cotesia glomerata]|uniref:Uncharacterized protein n=1 Tax=Cotesia glomerata TaxID=32391 RepID=A0AAV7ILG1_COTGL|nr:hypothetical protein KQX54_003095 [Cotesia glomerata]